MAGYPGSVTAQVLALLTSTVSGVNARIAAIEGNDTTLKGVGIRAITAQNVSIELAESAGQTQYPALFVYCTKMENLLREKSRALSGRVHLAIEVRLTQEKLQGIEQNTEMYVDAVCAMLGDSRGDWGDGTQYAGGYSVNYEPVVKGGKNFVQRAKVNFALEVSE